MSVGIAVSKAEVDSQAGAIARSVFNVVQTVGQFKAWLDGRSTADLVALGYDENEAAILKSAFGDLAELGSVFVGNAPLYAGSAHDFRAFAKQLLGTGLY